MAHSQRIEQPQETTKLVELDGLLGHLSSCVGLYSKETFLSLFSCVTRMIRDHRMKGLVFTRTLGDDAFEAMTLSLQSLPELSLQSLDNTPNLPADLGFLLVLTNRMCVSLHWSVASEESFRMYEGGWTFNPADVKTLTTHLLQRLDSPELPDLIAELDGTPIDRRYDEKLNLLITSLVNGLENRNRELTIALDKVNHLNQQVVESERLAAIGQLCSVIAHEIRNPLGLIDLYAKITQEQIKQAGQNLANTAPDTLEKLTQNLDHIRESTQHLETILSELTSYSRPLQLQCEQQPIARFVQEICDWYRPTYNDKGITLTWIVPADEVCLIEVSIDPGKIRQALVNLLKNALEVSQAGQEVEVVVASRQGDEQVFIKIRDHGPGIKPESKAKLFTPYFSTKSTGTGLGLAHSRKILQAHGGTVEVLSSSEAGSTFALILPKQDSHSKQAANAH